jgi:hypothetical protein
MILAQCEVSRPNRAAAGGWLDVNLVGRRTLAIVVAYSAERWRIFDVHGTFYNKGLLNGRALSFVVSFLHYFQPR